MKRKLNDEQIDHLMRTLGGHISRSGQDTDEIAGSPTLWWAIKRDIDAQRATAVSPWPPANWLRDVLAYGIPVVSVAAIIISLLMLLPRDVERFDMAAAITSVPIVSGPEAGKLMLTQMPAIPPASAPTTRRPVVKRQHNTSHMARPKPVTENKRPEIKTDFIALSYARSADSGQIVRVRVPSSMMVAVGLVETVDKPMNLIDAEVLIGDDGLTRAIRFIR